MPISAVAKSQRPGGSWNYLNVTGGDPAYYIPPLSSISYRPPATNHGLEIKGRQPESVISRPSLPKFLDTYSWTTPLYWALDIIMATFARLTVKLNDAVRWHRWSTDDVWIYISSFSLPRSQDLLWGNGSKWRDRELTGSVLAQNSQLVLTWVIHNTSMY